MGLFSLSFAGGAFILIGAWESLISFSSSRSSSRKSPPNQPHHHHHHHHRPSPSSPRHSTVTLVGTFALSLLFFSFALFALLDAHNSHDSTGTALQLQTLSVSALFLLFSLLGLSTNLSPSLSFPYPLTTLVALFAFAEEFLLFYLQRKDPAGVENRYFDLMLIPIAICLFSTLIDLKSPDHNTKPRIARGIGLILHGTWLVQMGFSFYTDWIARNCALTRKSLGNYTIRCNDHMDDHRGKAIPVLLFNCHLAFLVAVVAGVYSLLGRGRPGYGSYEPIGVETQMANQSRFTLDSDDEDGGIAHRIGEGNAVGRESGDDGGALQVMTANGH